MYFKAADCTNAEKDPLYEQEDVLKVCSIKKGAGRNHKSPCYHSRFALSDAHAFGYPSANLGRQKLAALGTTAGKNLAAVGSSHSLTETVNLAAVTAAGLIGTLHVVHLLSKSHMLNSPIGRSNA